MEVEPVSRAFYISSGKPSTRLSSLQVALREGPVMHERWPAVLGGPALLTSHRAYLNRGVEWHLYSRRCRPKHQTRIPCSLVNVSSWGLLGNYLSHVTLLEHVAAFHSGATSNSSAVLILQDDIVLRPFWDRTLRIALGRLALQQQQAGWSRVLLTWFGNSRPEDCNNGFFCKVRPPPGPTADGRRFYHGLQASVVRVSVIPCLLRCLAERQIKAVDALLVICSNICPGSTWALREKASFASHASGSLRAMLDTKWRPLA